jgi:hypothetical protein
VPQVVRSGVLDACELPRAMPRAVEGVVVELPAGRSTEDEIARPSGVRVQVRILPGALQVRGGLRPGDSLASASNVRQASVAHLLAKNDFTVGPSQPFDVNVFTT